MIHFCRISLHKNVKNVQFEDVLSKFIIVICRAYNSSIDVLLHVKDRAAGGAITFDL